MLIVFLEVTLWIVGVLPRTLASSSSAEVSSLQLTVQKADPVKFATRQRPRKDGAGEGDSLSSEESVPEELSCCDSEAGSLASGCEAEAEAAVEEEEQVMNDSDAEHQEPEELQAPERPERLPAGSHVIQTDGYFTLLNYAILSEGKHTDCKMVLRPRWAQPEPHGMGVANKSKTVQIRLYDIDIQNPRRTYCVLRCWAVWRARQGSWLRGHAARQLWCDSEIAALRVLKAELCATPGSTGCRAADDQIRQWLPEVLQ